jgi:transcriptional regulator with PAS, ATPase and Fis domain
MEMLVSWVALADLNASRAGADQELGPVAAALVERPFDRAFFLCNYDEDDLKRYLPWLMRTIGRQLPYEYLMSGFADPTDHAEIYRFVTPVLDDMLARTRPRPSLTFHLSPGTPSMASVWVLLATTRYSAKMIQTSKKRGLVDTRLPFEIAMEFVPQLTRQADERFQELTAGRPPKDPAFAEIAYRSREMQRVVGLARRVAPSSAPVLIEGETGTGKELFARAIHGSGLRKDGPFIPVNCGAIPESLVESELFGHEKGAFTGAEQMRKGVFEAADGGTLFLDEVGELPANVQVKLLRVLQDRKVSRIGSTREIPCDVRIIAATNRNLVEAVRDGSFRSDLFYRLAVAVLQLPPLRQRTGDIGLLIDHHLQRLNQSRRDDDAAWRDRSLAPAARTELLNHRWPGNVRELVNTLTRALIWSIREKITGPEIRQALLPPLTDQQDPILNRPLGGELDVRRLCDEVRRHYVIRALGETRGNKSRAAELIGVANYQTLDNWMKRLGIE